MSNLNSRNGLYDISVPEWRNGYPDLPTANGGNKIESRVASPARTESVATDDGHVSPVSPTYSDETCLDGRYTPTSPTASEKRGTGIQSLTNSPTVGPAVGPLAPSNGRGYTIFPTIAYGETIETARDNLMHALNAGGHLVTSPNEIAFPVEIPQRHYGNSGSFFNIDHQRASLPKTGVGALVVVIMPSPFKYAFRMPLFELCVKVDGFEGPFLKTGFKTASGYQIAVGDISYVDPYQLDDSDRDRDIYQSYFIRVDEFAEKLANSTFDPMTRVFYGYAQASSMARSIIFGTMMEPREIGPDLYYWDLDRATGTVSLDDRALWEKHRPRMPLTKRAKTLRMASSAIRVGVPYVNTEGISVRDTATSPIPDLANIFNFYNGPPNSPPSPRDVTYVLAADAHAANYDARKFPISAPHGAEKGLKYHRFADDFLTGISVIDLKDTNEIYDLAETLIGIDDSGAVAPPGEDDPTPLPTTAPAIKRRKRRLKLAYAYLYQHITDISIRNMLANEAANDGRAAWNILKRECDLPITDLELEDLKQNVRELTISSSVGYNVYSVSLFRRALADENAKIPDPEQRLPESDLCLILLRSIGKASSHIATWSDIELKADTNQRQFVYPEDHPHEGKRSLSAIVEFFEPLWKAAVQRGTIATRMPATRGTGNRVDGLAAQLEDLAADETGFDAPVDEVDTPALVLAAVSSALRSRPSVPLKEILCWNCKGVGHPKSKCPSDRRERSYEAVIALLTAVMGKKNGASGTSAIKSFARGTSGAKGFRPTAHAAIAAYLMQDGTVCPPCDDDDDAVEPSADAPGTSGEYDCYLATTTLPPLNEAGETPPSDEEFDDPPSDAWPTPAFLAAAATQHSSALAEPSSDPVGAHTDFGLPPPPPEPLPAPPGDEGVGFDEEPPEEVFLAAARGTDPFGNTDYTSEPLPPWATDAVQRHEIFQHGSFPGPPMLSRQRAFNPSIDVLVAVTRSVASGATISGCTTNHLLDAVSGVGAAPYTLSDTPPPAPTPAPADPARVKCGDNSDELLGAHRRWKLVGAPGVTIRPSAANKPRGRRKPIPVTSTSAVVLSRLSGVSRAPNTRRFMADIGERGKAGLKGYKIRCDKPPPAKGPPTAAATHNDAT